MLSDLAEENSLASSFLAYIVRQDELLVIKNARYWEMLSNDALTVDEQLLYDYWSSILSYEWETNGWYENLTILAEIIDNNFTILRDFQEVGFLEYMQSRRVDSLDISTERAVKHTFHSGKYEHTIRQSSDKRSLPSLATAGDAILRLLATVVVDAIDVVWKRQDTPCSIFGREGPKCEAKAATRAVKNKHLAVLFDKMGVYLWYPMDSSNLSEKDKGTIMEYLIAKLYEVRGVKKRLSELVLVCMTQCTIWFAIYDTRRKKNLVPLIFRDMDC